MSFKISVENSAIAFGCEAGETVLDAAERAGYSLPYSAARASVRPAKPNCDAATSLQGRSK